MTEPVVTVEQGQLKGKTVVDYLGGTFYSFLGIPYAKAPEGELRFKAPLPPESWDGIRDATQEGPACPSRHTFFAYFIGSENNCLNLNIYTRDLPTKDNPSLKPVMVWIHGGGFIHGSNKSDAYGPEYLITEDIVLVIINYRLGVFGFLCLEDSSLGVPGNAGLKDMVMALKWIQKNIRNFNGDHNNVTIFGESAGAASVHYLCLSPLSTGLFHKAIAQSGCALNCWAQGCINGGQIAKALGYKETDERKILEYLRSIPPQKIVEALHSLPDDFHAGELRLFGPVVEKPSDEPGFLTEDPRDILKSGNYNKVPLIMGYNSREGLFFEVLRKFKPGAKVNNIEQEISFVLKSEKDPEEYEDIVKKTKHFYYGEKDFSSEDVETLVLLQGDTQFIHGIHQSICYHNRNFNTPIYAYRMSLETSINYFKYMCTVKSLPVAFVIFITAHMLGDGIIKKTLLKLSDFLPRNQFSGTCHGDDVGYLFKTSFEKKIEPGSIEDISIKRFIKLWTNFAKTGYPTPDSKDQLLNVDWIPITQENHMILDIGEELKMQKNPDLERMQFWDDIYDS